MKGKQPTRGAYERDAHGNRRNCVCRVCDAFNWFRFNLVHEGRPVATVELYPIIWCYCESCEEVTAHVEDGTRVKPRHRKRAGLFWRDYEDMQV